MGSRSADRDRERQRMKTQIISNHFSLSEEQNIANSLSQKNCKCSSLILLTTRGHCEHPTLLYPHLHLNLCRANQEHMLCFITFSIYSPASLPHYLPITSYRLTISLEDFEGQKLFQLIYQFKHLQLFLRMILRNKAKLPYRCFFKMNIFCIDFHNRNCSNMFIAGYKTRFEC